MSIDGVEFDEAWERKVESHVGPEPVNFISKQDLIRNKQATGRHIDLHDLEQLEANTD
ncbi:MAG: hypothetical protein GY953_33160 [bacterium]|nr:hypothetical protein [bacterium]